MATNGYEKWPLGHKKLLNYLYYMVRKESFKNDVRKIRKQFHIPEEGFAFDMKNKTTQFEFPKNFEITTEQKKEFFKILGWLVTNNDMGPFFVYKKPLAFIVAYDLIVLPDYYDLCSIQDNKRDLQALSAHGDEMYSNDTHPISIRLTPYVSEREIIDFVKYNYKRYIKPLQNFHRKPKVEVGKIRSKKDISQDIADYVWENREKTGAQIAQEVIDNFSVSLGGYEGANKLRAIERRRR